MANDRAWNKTAERLKLDYKHDENDNKALALVIYKTQGIRAWLAYNPATGRCVWEKQYQNHR